MMNDPEDEALNRILGDMDGMESKRMGMGGGDSKGVSITISVVPNGEGGEEDHAEPDGDEYPEGHDIGMCKGGCAMHKGGAVGMASGGLIPPAGIPEENMSEDKTLPPFLRKKKKSLPGV